MSEQEPINTEIIKIPDSMKSYDVKGNPKPATGFNSGESNLIDRTPVPVESKVVPVERPAVPLTDEQAGNLDSNAIEAIAARSGLSADVVAQARNEVLASNNSMSATDVAHNDVQQSVIESAGRIIESDISHN